MGLLKWFNKETYKGLGEVLQAIRKELQALQPTDSQDIVWNKTANGMSASLRNSNTGSGLQSEIEDSTTQPVTLEYNGYFKIVAVPLTSTDGQPTGQIEVRIVDGYTYNPTSGSSNFNYFKVNGVFAYMQPYKSDPLSAVGTHTYLFYLQYDVTNETPSILMTTSASPRPENAELIGEVGVLESVVSVRQYAFGVIHLLVFAPCGIEDSEDSDE